MQIEMWQQYDTNDVRQVDHLPFPVIHFPLYTYCKDQLYIHIYKYILIDKFVSVAIKIFYVSQVLM